MNDKNQRSTNPDALFYILSRNDWDKARKTGVHNPETLRSVGYLHASLAHQVLPVANSVFRGRGGLVLLELDPSKLKSEVKNEDLRRSGSPYPHIYGPINADAVVAVHRFEPGRNGTFVWPKG